MVRQAPSSNPRRSRSQPLHARRRSKRKTLPKPRQRLPGPLPMPNRTVFQRTSIRSLCRIASLPQRPPDQSAQSQNPSRKRQSGPFPKFEPDFRRQPTSPRDIGLSGVRRQHAALLRKRTADGCRRHELYRSRPKPDHGAALQDLRNTSGRQGLLVARVRDAGHPKCGRHPRSRDTASRHDLLLRCADHRVDDLRRCRPAAAVITTRPTEVPGPHFIHKEKPTEGCPGVLAIVVRMVGLEPTWIAPADFESAASTISPHPHPGRVERL